MRMLVFLLLCGLAACGGPLKRHGGADSLTVRVGTEAPHVSFDAPGWRALPNKAPSNQVVLVHPAHADRGVAVWIEYAKPGTTIQSALSEFGIMLLAVPVLFAEPEQVGKVEVVSDEEATFAFRGVDSRTKVGMFAFCRVRLVSGHGTAYWAMILTYGPEAEGPLLIMEAGRLAQSLRIEAPVAP